MDTLLTPSGMAGDEDEVQSVVGDSAEQGEQAADVAAEAQGDAPMGPDDDATDFETAIRDEMPVERPKKSMSDKVVAERSKDEASANASYDIWAQDAWKAKPKGPVPRPPPPPVPPRSPPSGLAGRSSGTAKGGSLHVPPKAPKATSPSGMAGGSDRAPGGA